MLDYQQLYAEHLSDGDLELIARAVGLPDQPGELRSRLRERPERVDELLGSEEVFDALYGQGTGEPALEVGVTPFLVFGVLVNKVARDLAGTSFVPEWVGSGQRLPVFDTATLTEFIDDGFRRYFLIEFLASFTKIASGSVWVRTRRGYRRRRFSELDPVGLAEMVEAMPPYQRPAGYRRLGDVSLFLTGVFPDHTTRNTIGELARTRLALSAGVEADVSEILLEGEVRFFEIVGSAWYGRAVETAAESVGAGPEYLRDVAGHFTDARRFLNFLSDRYLHRLDTGLMNPAV